MNTINDFGIMSNTKDGEKKMINDYSKELRNFVYDLVSNYHKPDRSCDDGYSIELSDIPDNEQFKFIRLLILDGLNYFSFADYDEDNKAVYCFMHLLKNPTSHDARVDFIDQMINGCLDGFERDMKELLDEQFTNWLQNHHAESGYWRHQDDVSWRSL